MNEEQIVREVFALWSTGSRGIVESFQRHAAEDIVWWNCARVTIEGLPAIAAGLSKQAEMVGFARCDVQVRTLLVAEGVVMVERSDDLYDAEGNLMISVPVTGVVEFRGPKISNWRDYADDWMRDVAGRDKAFGRSH